MKKVIYLFSGILLCFGLIQKISAQEVENPQEELIENDWYLTKLLIEEEIPFLPTEDLPEITLNFANEPVMDEGFPSYMVESTSCESGSGTIWLLNDDTFELDGFYFMANDNWFCDTEESGAYSNLYFASWQEENDPLYPAFQFSIMVVENHKELIVIKENGNRFYFQSVPYLSAENQHKSNLMLYPNPVKDQLNIKNLTENVQLGIYDLSGRKLLDQELSNSAESINISHLSEGIYFYEIHQNGKPVKSGKLMKK